MTEIVLVISELQNGQYAAYHNSQKVVKSSRQPFLTAARVLLAQGLKPNARYVMRRSINGPDALISTLGRAAKLTVAEADTSPRFVAWNDPGVLRARYGQKTTVAREGG